MAALAIDGWMEKSDVYVGLVREHDQMVRGVVRRVYSRLSSGAHCFEEEDLVSVGMLGLLDAHKRWEPGSGVQFSTFARHRVKGAILDEIRRHDFFPRRLRAQANRIKATKAELETALGRKPTDQEVADQMGMAIDAYMQLCRDAVPYGFVSEAAYESLTSTAPLPEQAAAAGELKTQLLAAVMELAEREQLVLDLYFTQELRLREIAEVLDLTEGRISQIKTAALRQLKRSLAQSGVN